MFAGATVLVTIVSALSIGIFAGWAALAAILHLFAPRTQKPQKVAVAAVAAPAIVAHSQTVA